MLRLLSDENFNGDIIRGLFLRRTNLDLLRVQDVGLRKVDDPAILSWAATDNRIVLTLTVVNSQNGRGLYCTYPCEDQS